jgi:predicted metal-binding protein
MRSTITFYSGHGVNKEKEMLKNIEYDLIETVAIISKSLECKSCQDIWTNKKEQREKELKMLLEELKKHVGSRKM